MSKLSSRLGRPPGKPSEQVKEQLLASARGLFISREFSAVSIKQIAAGAGVNPAMVHYYFDDKRGLYLAMAEGLLGPMLLQLERVPETDRLESFITAYTQTLAQNPWWPGFMVREVLFGGAEFRESFARTFGARMRDMLSTRVKTHIETGALRKDLHPELTVASLMGMLVFPFLVGPMMLEVFGVDPGRVDPALLASHTTQLFLNGARNE